MKAAQWKLEAAKGEVVQAGTLPNPTLATQLENFGGTRGYSGTHGLEVTTALNQVFETGGKRKLRRAAAEQEVLLAETELASNRFSLLLEAHQLFWEILLAQEKVSIEDEDLRTAHEFLQVQEIRKNAGKSPLLEIERARTALLAAELAKRRAEREILSLQTRLSPLIGKDTGSNYSLQGDLADLEALPSPDSLAAASGKNLERIRGEREVDLRLREAAFEKSKAYPDVEVEAGWRHSSEVSSYGFLAGVTLPLPLWDRNQGSIARANAKVSQAREEIRVAGRRNQSQLRERYLNLVGLHADVIFIRDSLLNAATSTFRSAQEGFSLGRFSPLEILDARRTYLDARRAYLEALAEYHRLTLEWQGFVVRGTSGDAGTDKKGRE